MRFTAQLPRPPMPTYPIRTTGIFGAAYPHILNTCFLFFAFCTVFTTASFNESTDAYPLKPGNNKPPAAAVVFFKKFLRLKLICLVLLCILNCLLFFLVLAFCLLEFFHLLACAFTYFIIYDTWITINIRIAVHCCRNNNPDIFSGRRCLNMQIG